MLRCGWAKSSSSPFRGGGPLQVVEGHLPHVTTLIAVSDGGGAPAPIPTPDWFTRSHEDTKRLEAQSFLSLLAEGNACRVVER